VYQVDPTFYFAIEGFPTIVLNKRH